MQIAIDFLQAELKRKGYDPGPIDGVMGSKTRAALAKVKDLPKSWPDERKAVGFIQLVATAEGIEAGKIDGLWGPQTSFAYNSLKQLRLTGALPPTWRPEEIQDVNPHSWPSQKNEQDLIAFYGEVGTNQTTIVLPYPHILAWDTAKKVTKFSCHKKVHDSMLRVLTKVKNHYGIQEISRLHLDMWGGCLNVRKMRGGSRFSMHSWGIAVDYDPENNQLNWGRDRATFAQPEYTRWWELWEEEGWLSLGRTRNFDWMHVQAAKL